MKMPPAVGASRSHDLGEHHRDMTVGRQRVRRACGIAAGAHCAPPAGLAARRPGAERAPEVAEPVLGLFPVLGEALGLPDLELVALADEGDPLAESGVVLDRVGEDDAALGVELEDLALADQRRRQELVVLGEGLEIGEVAADRLPETVAAGIDRLAVQRRAAIDAVESVHRQHGAILRRDRDAPLGVDLVGVGGNELVHRPRPPRRTVVRPRSRRKADGPASAPVRIAADKRAPGALSVRRRTRSGPRLGLHGISWDNGHRQTKARDWLSREVDESG